MGAENNVRLEDYFKQFKVQYSGLALGPTEFQFEIIDAFFKKFEGSDIEKGKIIVKLLWYKEETMMTLTFSLDGKVESICDKCADDLILEVKGEEQLFCKFHHENEMLEHDDVIFLPYRGYELDLSQFIYEFIYLLLPFRKVHKNEADCNQDTLKHIEKLNNTKNIDPRWDALKDLLNN